MMSQPVIGAGELQFSGFVSLLFLIEGIFHPVSNLTRPSPLNKPLPTQLSAHE
jgi:hypothetical protein